MVEKGQYFCPCFDGSKAMYENEETSLPLPDLMFLVKMNFVFKLKMVRNGSCARE